MMIFISTKGVFRGTGSGLLYWPTSLTIATKNSSCLGCFIQVSWYSSVTSTNTRHCAGGSWVNFKCFLIALQEAKVTVILNQNHSAFTEKNVRTMWHYSPQTEITRWAFKNSDVWVPPHAVSFNWSQMWLGHREFSKFTKWLLCAASIIKHFVGDSAIYKLPLREQSSELLDK